MEKQSEWVPEACSQSRVCPHAELTRRLSGLWWHFTFVITITPLLREEGSWPHPKGAVGLLLAHAAGALGPAAPLRLQGAASLRPRRDTWDAAREPRLTLDKINCIFQVIPCSSKRRNIDVSNSLSRSL